MSKDQPVDELRKKILGFPVSTFEDGSPMYLEDVFPNIVESDFADNVVELLQAECNRARLNEAQMANQFNDKIDADTPYGELDAQEDTENYLNKRIAELQQLMKEGER